MRLRQRGELGELRAVPLIPDLIWYSPRRALTVGAAVVTRGRTIIVIVMGVHTMTTIVMARRGVVLFRIVQLAGRKILPVRRVQC